MRERSAADVLSAEAHPEAVEQQGSERDLFGRAPVDRLAPFGHCAALRQHRLELRVRCESLRRRSQRGAYAIERFPRDRRVWRGLVLIPGDILVGPERVATRVG